MLYSCIRMATVQGVKGLVVQEFTVVTILIKIEAGVKWQELAEQV